MNPKKQIIQNKQNNRNRVASEKSSKIIFKKITLALFFFLLISGLSVIGGISYFNHFVTTPADPPLPSNSSGSESAVQSNSLPPHGKNVLFTIKSGQSLQQTADELERTGIIKNRHLFRLLAMVRGSATKIQAGEYLLSGSHSPETILNRLVTGKVILHKITIPEGLTIKEIALLVEQAGFGSSASFIQLTSDRYVISTAGITRNMRKNENKEKESKNRKDSADKNNKESNIPPSLEGYLFPDTYFFPVNTSQKEIINSMIKRFHQVFTPQWRERCRTLGLSPHEIVVLASIIEKETGAAHERPMISSVFHNRLKKKMRLQSDPTVIYGIPNFNGNITRKDLRRVTPYNTYTISGLPAGPIANPGKLSLQAALFPEQTGYIYFVSKNDTTHYFSKTLQEHNRAVRKYQLGK